ncbi:amelotin [Sus scrofa]|uniref:amelotin n=1 Tax=Sus scrofa TaxID=9823 RepID=UPI000A2B2E2D|nr:amelotin [Sus scrofa]
MKTTILLFCLLGSTLSLPMQFNPVLGLPPTKLVPDQATLRNQQQPNQVFPSLSLIPLTQMLTLGSDLQLLNPAIGMVPSSQTLPLTLGALNVQQQLQPQVSSRTYSMIPVIVAHLGAQGAILSSEELFLSFIPFQPATRQILTGLIFHTLFPGAILPPSPAKPDAQNGIHPAGQAGANPAVQGTPRGPFPTSSGTDDDFDVTTPAGLQRGTHATEETTTGSPNGKFSKPGKCP